MCKEDTFLGKKQKKKAAQGIQMLFIWCHSAAVRNRKSCVGVLQWYRLHTLCCVIFISVYTLKEGWDNVLITVDTGGYYGIVRHPPAGPRPPGVFSYLFSFYYFVWSPQTLQSSYGYKIYNLSKSCTCRLNVGLVSSTVQVCRRFTGLNI